MTGDRTVSIRLATLDDLDHVTKLHLASFTPEDHVPVMLGPRYVKATYRWQISTPDAYTLVAELDGAIVGLVAVCDKPFTRPMFMGCLGEFFISVLKNPTLLMQAALWKRLFRRSGVSGKGDEMASHPGMAQMTIGAVDAECRGAGIFPALIEATKVFSRQRGSRAVRAGVYKTNAPCQRVFIKGGWIETPELETADTVFYVAYFDSSLPEEFGIILPCQNDPKAC
ncbi:MAG: hypothetical protein PHP44_12410 [Kiritimatiellae bacterium]|nr:hypothetical protein [Kiritimatiellia bacterium]